MGSCADCGRQNERFLAVRSVPGNVLSENGHVVGNDERTEHTRGAAVRRSADGTVQPGHLFQGTQKK